MQTNAYLAKSQAKRRRAEDKQPTAGIVMPEMSHERDTAIIEKPDENKTVTTSDGIAQLPVLRGKHYARQKQIATTDLNRVGSLQSKRRYWQLFLQMRHIQMRHIQVTSMWREDKWRKRVVVPPYLEALNHRTRGTSRR